MTGSQLKLDSESERGNAVAVSSRQDRTYKSGSHLNLVTTGERLDHTSRARQDRMRTEDHSQSQRHDHGQDRTLEESGSRSHLT